MRASVSVQAVMVASSRVQDVEILQKKIISRVPVVVVELQRETPVPNMAIERRTVWIVKGRLG